MITEPTFVRKYSGICLEDYSSGKGGFCLLETNDTDMSGSYSNAPFYSTSNTVALSIYDVDTADPTNPVVKTNERPLGEDTNRAIETYRLTQAEFTTLTTAWTDTAATDDSGLQDGRVYQAAMASGLVPINSVDANNIEYLNYPKCALSADTDATTSDWTCQMFLRAEDQQEDGYPAFRTPGVISGYFVASYMPALEILSFNKVTDFIVYDGASSVAAYSAAILAGVATLMF